MGAIENAINWEIFFDNYIERHRPLTEKNEYKNGLTIQYSKNNIYVWCDLSLDRKTIKKLEFGRLIPGDSGHMPPNWVKGVFINDGNIYTTFLQTSYDNEYFDKKTNYQISISKVNEEIIARFLDIPCSTGWTEEEYRLDHDMFYKIIVSLGSQKWTIKLQDVGEQDMPFATDVWEIWIRVKIADAFWNNKRRTIKKIVVSPMGI